MAEQDRSLVARLGLFECLDFLQSHLGLVAEQSRPGTSAGGHCLVSRRVVVQQAHARFADRHFVHDLLVVRVFVVLKQLLLLRGLVRVVVLRVSLGAEKRLLVEGRVLGVRVVRCVDNVKLSRSSSDRLLHSKTDILDMFWTLC